ncbi:DUF2946 family protein [Phenylobacterium deserti]|uniref:DUF2946 domain-containing protein n=1 Tax=Phenylobacterium deserti TaxID=1914756 RepID=A0A328ATY4_9CAUL|nr:DUF2946 family protein [Phenylobacterium deserti]RAK57735.1 DUF2946 domain-containing protein [Phenylobacterium deserti]
MRRGHTPVAVLLTFLALMIQALLPGAAAASQGAGSETMVICGAMGVQTVEVPADPGQGKKSFAGLPCADCLAPSLAALPAPEPAVTTVVYAAQRVEHDTAPELWPQLARAPPRPPGQGPPTL